MDDPLQESARITSVSIILKKVKIVKEMKIANDMKIVKEVKRKDGS